MNIIVPIFPNSPRLTQLNGYKAKYDLITFLQSIIISFNAEINVVRDK